MNEINIDELNLKMLDGEMMLLSENDTIEKNDIEYTIEERPPTTVPATYKPKPKPNTQHDCELQLAYMDKVFSNQEPTEKYLKGLKKRITEFRKITYKNLTAEDKQTIQLLDRYPLTIINKSIKKNIDDMNEILKQKNSI